MRLQERKLLASERPKAIYEYRVKGRGVFPIDMLRYDSCWPADGESAGVIADNVRSVRADASVILRSYDKPTEARWNSFGWVVTERHGLPV